MLNNHTEKLMTLVDPNYEIVEIVREGQVFDGWKIIRKRPEGNSILGFDLFPVALIKRDFVGFHLISQEPDDFEMIKNLAAKIESEFAVKIPLPQ